MATRSWLPDPGQHILATRSWLPDPGNQIFATTFWLPHPSYQSLASRSWLLDPGYQNLAARSWLPDPGNDVLCPILISPPGWSLALGSYMYIFSIQSLLYAALTFDKGRSQWCRPRAPRDHENKEFRTCIINIDVFIPL